MSGSVIMFVQLAGVLHSEIQMSWHIILCLREIVSILGSVRNCLMSTDYGVVHNGYSLCFYLYFYIPRWCDVSIRFMFLSLNFRLHTIFFKWFAQQLTKVDKPAHLHPSTPWKEIDSVFSFHSFLQSPSVNWYFLTNSPLHRHFNSLSSTISVQ